jgi:hypothetical protein
MLRELRSRWRLTVLSCLDMLGGTALSWILHVVLKRRMVLLVDCHPGEHDSELHPVTTMASTSDMSSRETVLVFLPP